jgi:hypothetical protein
MEKTFSNEFKKRFLLAFTRELILHSAKGEIIQLQNIIISEEKNKEIPPAEKETTVKGEFIGRVSEFPVQAQKQITLAEKKIAVAPIKPMIQQVSKPTGVLVKQKPVIQKPRGRLRIPEARLPPHLEYLKPTLAEIKNVTDWEKLNPLIRDKAVRVIEVNPNEKIKVSGSMGERLTNITLNSEEINEIINKFSYISKIPVSEGVYKVVVENLIFFAVISSVVGSRFVIQKIQPLPANIYPNNSQIRY